MRFTDTAILLSLTPYSESTAICRLFGCEHGLISGAVRGALSRKNRGNYQPGNILQLEWSARLAEHLGSLKCELQQPIAAYVMNDPLRLAALNSLLALTGASMAEHDPHPKLYQALKALLQALKQNENWQESYARFELLLLEESGFQLELTRCVATGETENLIYVSPKSGSAVSAEAGEPYKDKLLRLPEFLLFPLPRGRGQRGLPSERRLSRVGEGDKSLSYTNQAQINARNLRQEMTEAEKKLWYRLRDNRFESIKFRRQQPVDNYIVDFLSMEKKLIIELDGGQHSDQKEYDDRRTQFLQSKGFEVVRFWNHEILDNIEGVMDSIRLAITPSPTSLTSSSRRGSSVALSLKGEEFTDALTLTGYFLEHRLFASHGRSLPKARERLVEKVNKDFKSAAEAANSAV